MGKSQSKNTTQRIEEPSSRVHLPIQTTCKIPPTLCGMPWNVKRTIVDSLVFSARNRLHQCSSEFKQLIDSSKIVYDRVVLSFEEVQNIHITVYQNGEKQLKLTFYNFSMSSCIKRVNDNRDKFVRQYDYYIPVALPYLLQKINRPNVTIRELEVHFYECSSEIVSPQQWENNRVIIEMTRLLSFARLSNIEAPKIRAKCFRLKHHGSEDFLRSFLPFLDKNTLEHVSLAYNSTNKKEEYMMAVKMTGYETCITTPIVTVDQLKHVIQMMMNTSREHYLMRHTESFNGPLYNYLSQWPIDPLGRMNSRMLPIPNSTDYLSVEIFMNDVFIKRVFA